MNRPSPFPGMDPYLEDPDIWSGFHTPFFVVVMQRLNAILPPGYQAKVDRYVWIHEPDARERILLGKPDTYVVETTTGRTGASALSAPAPATIVLPAIRHEGNRYVKILDRARNRVVTVIEVLSPSNKTAGQDREAYLMKRNEYLGAGVNVIELDLLREGQRMPSGESPLPAALYYVMVSRSWEFPRAGVWPLSLRDPLPAIPIPLTETVAEPILPLQTCFDAAYREGRHADEIDYTQPPIPPLSEADTSWARQRIEEWTQCDA